MRYCICLVACLLVVGCAGLRDFTLEVSEEEYKNYQTAQQVARNYHAIWLMQSGFIRSALGPRLKMLPASAIEAMDELDALAQQDFEELDDKQKGESLGYRVMILSEAALEAVQAYAPDVWNVLTSIGLGI